MGIPAPLGVSASGAPPANDRANAVVSGVFSAVGPGLPFAIFGPANASIWASATTTLTTTAGSTAATVASATGLAVGASVNSVNVPDGTTIGALAGTAVTLALPTITLYGLLLSNGQITGLPSTSGLLGATVTGPGLPGAGLTVQAIAGSAAVQLSAPATPANPQGQQQPFQFQLTGSAVTGGADANATFTGASVTFSGTVQLERTFDGGSTWLPANIGGSGLMAQYSAGTPVNLAFGEPEQGVLYRWNCLNFVSGPINYRISTTGAAAMSLSLNQLA